MRLPMIHKHKLCSTWGGFLFYLLRTVHSVHLPMYWLDNLLFCLIFEESHNFWFVLKLWQYTSRIPAWNLLIYIHYLYYKTVLAFKQPFLISPSKLSFQIIVWLLSLRMCGYGVGELLGSCSKSLFLLVINVFYWPASP